ncbi:tetratricopeptide repeat protein [Roseibium polysiphoniae]|uniref:Tetratricopeptide repeat protein n=1 Tax=Roseibium polysiphoniae TaxID=2571221 RepID=A0ABR9CAU0_9HYPH|nr:tetratricopeptide repeat protein [Roseibium polysiphoniae]MBD8876022.1 tetratricopeptide repeat protein [Roseibium polysiphoniae]
MTTPAREAFDEALKHERQGDQEAALSAYLNALEADPDDIEIAYRTATALLRAGYLEEAASQLRRIVFVEPDHLQARANLGNCQLLLDDLGNAESNFEGVLAASPDNHNALYGLATVRLRQDKTQSALAPAERLMALLPENAPTLTLYAQITAKDPQASRAAAAYHKALGLDPSYVPALTGLSELLIRRKRYDEALMYADKALKLSPESADLHKLVAEAHFAAGNLDFAKSAYWAALTRATDDKTTILTSLSVVCRKLGDGEAALVHAHRAFEKAPDRKDAGNALGAALKALGHPKDARAVLTATAQSKPLDEALTTRIGRLAAEIRLAASSAPGQDTRDDPAEQVGNPTGSPEGPGNS